MFDKPKSDQKGSGPKPDIAGEVVEKLFFGLIIVFIFGAAATFKILQARPELYTGVTVKKRWMMGLGAFAVLLSMIGACKWMQLNAPMQVVLYVFASWALGFLATWGTASVWLQHSFEDRITVKILTRKTIKSDALNRMLNSPEAAPIGVSLKDGRPFAIPIPQRREHTIIAGATGQGKTTLMMTLFKHSSLHKHPVIIIDPKGEVRDIERMKSFALALGRDISDFRLFSLAAPKSSARYNPLESGTPEQRKAKLMDGLDLKHEYYGAVASKYLGSLLDVFEFTGVETTLRNIEQALLDKTFLARIHQDLSHREESDDVNRLLAKLASIQKIDLKELAGLSAQIESFNSREFVSLLSPPKDDPAQIRLLDVLAQGQIAYFQMNVNGYGDIARRIGKLIIQDLKAASSLLHAGQADIQFDFAACFIDEFGSFATSDFADFLKQVRSTNIGVHLLCQGMADLRAVSPEFESQVLGNTVTKIIFRTDLSEDAEGWAGMSGTMDAFDNSYQVTRNFLWSERTGSGTQNPSKKMKIDFDVFKNLMRGQAVVIDKARGLQDVVSIWDAKSESISSIQPKSSSRSKEQKSNSEMKSVGFQTVNDQALNAHDWISERRKTLCRNLVGHLSEKRGPQPESVDVLTLTAPEIGLKELERDSLKPPT